MVLNAYFPLNEASGSEVYDVSGARHGSTQGTVVQGATGILGEDAYEFDGNGYLSLPTSIVKGVQTGSLVSTIYVPDTLSSDSDYAVAGYGGDKSDESLFFYIKTDSSGNFRPKMFHESGVGDKESYRTAESFPTGDWYHIVWVSDGSNARVFVNSREYSLNYENGSDTGVWWADISLGSDSSLRVGVREYSGSNGFYFSGKIADLRFYTHSLSKQEVTYLHQVINSGQLTTRKKNS